MTQYNACHGLGVGGWHRNIILPKQELQFYNFNDEKIECVKYFSLQQLLELENPKIYGPNKLVFIPKNDLFLDKILNYYDLLLSEYGNEFKLIRIPIENNNKFTDKEESDYYNSWLKYCNRCYYYFENRGIIKHTDGINVWFDISINLESQLIHDKLNIYLL
jgi:hypothetical protein